MRLSPHRARSDQKPLLLSADRLDKIIISNLHATHRRPHSFRRRERTFLRTSYRFSSYWRLNGFCVTTQHAEVCPVSRGMMLPCGATPIRPITGRPSLLPQSSADRSDRVTCASPACKDSRRRNDRFTAFDVKHTTGLGPFYPPAAPCPCDRKWQPINPTASRFGSGRQHLGPVNIHEGSEGSHLLALPASLAPSHLDAGSNRRSSQTLRPLTGGILVFRWLHTVPLPEPHATVDYGRGNSRFRSFRMKVEQCFTTLSRRTPFHVASLLIRYRLDSGGDSHEET